MEREDDDLLARVQAAATRVSPDPSAGERVRGALVRRRRRRRVQVSVASAAAVAAVSVAGVVVVPSVLGGDAGPEPAAPTTSGAPAVIGGAGYRPAGFFRDVVGGSALPAVTRYYRDNPRVVFTARFDWSPDPAGDAYLADLSLERYRSDPVTRCSRLVEAAAECRTLDDGTVVARYEIAADGAFLAPVSSEGRLRLDEPGGTLRGVTYFRDDARAVTVLVCDCSSQGGAVLGETPPVTFEVLEDVVTDPSWGERVGG